MRLPSLCMRCPFLLKPTRFCSTVVMYANAHAYARMRVQMQRTLRAKLLKSSSAERDERDKANLAAESNGTSPAWRNSVACMRVIAWLEAGEKLQKEALAAGRGGGVGRSTMEAHADGGAHPPRGWALLTMEAHADGGARAPILVEDGPTSQSLKCFGVHG